LRVGATHIIAGNPKKAQQNPESCKELSGFIVTVGERDFAIETMR